MSAAEQEIVDCNLCGSDRHRPLYIIQGSQVVRCTNCGLVFLNPRLVPSRLTAIYESEGYYRRSQTEEGPPRGYADYLSLRDHLRFVADEVLRPLKGMTPGKVLDVGCSMGIVLDRFREHGWQPYGVDVSPYATDHARRELGITVFTGTVEQVDLPSESLDLITMLLTVEHLSDPKSVLRDLNNVLKPGGVLVVGTHDIEGFWPRIVGPRWRHFEMPEHVYLFSRRTLTRMLAEVGLETFRVTETATLAAVTSARDGGVGLYAPVHLLRRTGLFPFAAPLLRTFHELMRRLDWSDGVTTYSRKI
ncbi:MAG: class I SAM-dependent methyltransferase [Gemmatimonadetes bacterium]|nr:class I SAM-dependent methyltransferase [Gemmatimonadota bacterium]